MIFAAKDKQDHSTAGAAPLNGFSHFIASVRVPEW